MIHGQGSLFSVFSEFRECCGRIPPTAFLPENRPRKNHDCARKTIEGYSKKDMKAHSYIIYFPLFCRETTSRTNPGTSMYPPPYERLASLAPPLLLGINNE